MKNRSTGFLLRNSKCALLCRSALRNDAIRLHKGEPSCWASFAVKTAFFEGQSSVFFEGYNNILGQKRAMSYCNSSNSVAPARRTARIHCFCLRRANICRTKRTERWQCSAMVRCFKRHRPSSEEYAAKTKYTIFSCGVISALSAKAVVSCTLSRKRLCFLCER